MIFIIARLRNQSYRGKNSSDQNGIVVGLEKKTGKINSLGLAGRK